jgi:glucosamine--fructose-6-phosphate aminotransferase (isomerizing)
VALVDGGVHVRKRAGKLAELDRTLEEDPPPSAHMGMGHTRWATHGIPSDRNAHPHLDCQGRIAVIHNGIIENFAELRARLEKEGHTLASDTDTECIAHLVEQHFEGDLGDAVRASIKQLEGAYAIVALAVDHPDHIVGAKVSSPLVVGLGEGENLLASDIPAVLSRTRSVIPIREGQVVEIGLEEVRITDFDGNEVQAEPLEIDWDVARAQKSGFDHFMLKEIHEQPAAVRDTLVGRVDAPGHLSLDEL